MGLYMDENFLIKNSKYIVGEEFIQENLGKGKCIDIYGDTIELDFEKSDKIRKFIFPDAIVNKNILFLDEEGAVNRIEEKIVSNEGMASFMLGKQNSGLETPLEVLRRHKVKHFVHYTRIKNIESILANGICSVEYMKEHQIPYISNDKQRLDRRENAISLSVSFPNYKNFYLARGNDSSEWCVILLDAEKVVQLDCAFFWTNAANSSCRYLQWDRVNDAKAFEKLFYQKGRSSDIPDRYTTDPQAEVMVKNVIPPEFIELIEFDETAGVIDTEKVTCKHRYDHRFFLPRKDHFEWDSHRF